MVTNCKLHGRYVQTPLSSLSPQAVPSCRPSQRCLCVASSSSRTASQSQSALRTASAHSSVCISHRPAFLGDNCISVCRDAPNSFQLEQTGNNSKNLHLLCVGGSSKHIICTNWPTSPNSREMGALFISLGRRGAWDAACVAGPDGCSRPLEVQYVCGSEHPCTFIFRGYMLGVDGRAKGRVHFKWPKLLPNCPLKRSSPLAEVHLPI